jgi:hypothetical protein
MSQPPRAPAALLVPCALPYLLYVGLGQLVDVGSHAEWLYGLRALAVAPAALFALRRFPPVRGPKSLAASLALGGLTGLAGTLLWIALAAPFAPATAPAWSDSAWLARALVATALPPLFEELLFRGWALRVVLLAERRRAAGWLPAFGQAIDVGSLDDVAPGEWSALALAVSSLLFAAGHLPREWPAAFAYGLLLCALWIARGDLVSCIAAHAVTNATLAVWVRASGSWAIW